MRKIFSFLAIFTLFLSGCSFPNAQANTSDFELKQNCAKYITVADKWAADQLGDTSNEQFTLNSIVTVDHEATYYSRTKNTCISIFYYIQNNGNTWYVYLDQLTDESQRISTENYDTQNAYLDFVK